MDRESGSALTRCMDCAALCHIPARAAQPTVHPALVLEGLHLHLLPCLPAFLPPDRRERVLSWAVAMQTLRAKQDELEEEQRQEQAAEVEQLAAAAAVSEAAGEVKQDGVASGGGPVTPAQAGLRRRRGGSGGAATEDTTEPSSRAEEVQAAASAAATAVWSVASAVLQAANPLHLAVAAMRLPWQLLSAASSVARWGLYRLPLVGERLEDWIEGTPTSEQLEAELQELEAQLAELEHASAEAGSNGAGAAGSTGDGTLRLSELAVQYGLSMLARSSGSTKAAIQPANTYERQLLDEVGAGWVF